VPFPLSDNVSTLRGNAVRPDGVALVVDGQRFNVRGDSVRKVRCAPVSSVGSACQLSQFFQTVQGYSAFGSGLRILPWTVMPMFVSAFAIGKRRRPAEQVVEVAPALLEAA